MLIRNYFDKKASNQLQNKSIYYTHTLLHSHDRMKQTWRDISILRPPFRSNVILTRICTFKNMQANISPTQLGRYGCIKQ